MSQTGDFQYPIHNLHRQRWSPRAFSSRSVEGEKLLSLLEAARWAPSCFNEQPWRFLITTKEEPEVFEKFLGCLVEGNRIWAAGAPIMMLTVASLYFQKNGKPNRHAFHDVGLAMGNLISQATHLGLFVHQMAGFDVEKARQVFHIPEGYEPVAAVALGYLGDPQSLPQQLREKELAPRVRRPIQEFAFSGNWKHPLSLLSR